jgi:hypothetical protein
MLVSGQYRDPVTLPSREQSPVSSFSVCPKAGLHEAEGKNKSLPLLGADLRSTPHVRYQKLSWLLKLYENNSLKLYENNSLTGQ